MRTWPWLDRKPSPAGGGERADWNLRFEPLPLLRNPDVQTLLGTLWNGQVRHYPTRERRVTLPDGDHLVLHDSVPEDWQPGRLVVFLVHGLGGSHRSGYMRRIAGLLVARGIRAFRIDLRGSGRGEGLARRTYNGGCSDDVRAAVMALHGEFRDSPVILAGFSLGGNIVLKLAGEAALVPLPGLHRVVAVAPTVDLKFCADLIGLKRNRLYELHFLRELVALARRHQRRFRDLPRLDLPRRLTLFEFDDLYTAPRGGYHGALDYYQRASSLPLLPRINVPTFILTARDDPFIAVEPLESFSAPSHMEVQIVPHGGHLGFLGWDGAGGIRWAEHRVVEWVSKALP
jgi:predicted alpha/beta-fold hydrolase